MKTSKLAVAWIGMAMSGLCQGAAEGIHVVIFDYVGIPGAILNHASDNARRAFHEAGVETTWSICRVSKDPDEHCVLPPAASYREAKIIAAWNGKVGTAESMGVAFSPEGEPGVTSCVFYDAVKDFGLSAGQDVSIVLGYVIAHEVAHLIGLKHSASGIMKPRFERRDVLDAAAGRLHFTRQEASALRAAASAGR